MAAELLVPLLGREVATVIVQYLTQAADGELTLAGSAATITLVLDGVEYSGVDDEEDISPVTSSYENPVSIQTNDTVTVMQWMRPASGTNSLASLKMLGYADSLLQLSYAVSVHAYVFTGRFSNFREQVRSGKSVMTAELQMVDTYDDAATPVVTVNPAYT